MSIKSWVMVSVFIFLFCLATFIDFGANSFSILRYNPFEGMYKTLATGKLWSANKIQIIFGTTLMRG